MNTFINSKSQPFLRGWLFFIFLSLTSCSSVFYQPDRKLHVAPQFFDIFPQDFTVQSDKETKISGWFFKAKKAKGTIVQFHGNAENMSSHYMMLIWVLKYNYNLITFDYRGYGRSQGEPSQEGLYKDGLALLNKAYEIHQKETPQGKLVLIGQSLGGAVLARSLIDSPIKSHTDLLVLDSTFSSYKEVANKILKRGWLTYILSPLSYLLISDEYKSEEALKELSMPAIVIHDQKDPIVPFSSGEKVYSLLGAKDKTFWKLDWRSHIAAFHSPFSPYRIKLMDYLSKLSPSQPNK